MLVYYHSNNRAEIQRYEENPFAEKIVVRVDKTR